MAKREMTFFNESGDYTHMVAEDKEIMGDTMISVAVNKTVGGFEFTMTMLEMENLFTMLSV